MGCATDLNRRADTAFDQVTVGVKHVRFKSRDALGRQLVAQRRGVLRDLHHDARRRFALHCDPGRIHVLQSRSQPKRPFRISAANVEAGDLPGVADKEGFPSLKLAVDMDDCAPGFDPIGRLKYESPSHKAPRSTEPHSTVLWHRCRKSPQSSTSPTCRRLLPFVSSSRPRQNPVSSLVLIPMEWHDRAA